MQGGRVRLEIPRADEQACSSRTAREGMGNIRSIGGSIPRDTAIQTGNPVVVGMVSGVEVQFVFPRSSDPLLLGRPSLAHPPHQGATLQGSQCAGVDRIFGLGIIPNAQVGARLIGGDDVPVHPCLPFESK